MEEILYFLVLEPKSQTVANTNKSYHPHCAIKHMPVDTIDRQCGKIFFPNIEQNNSGTVGLHIESTFCSEIMLQFRFEKYTTSHGFSSLDGPPTAATEQFNNTD